MIALRIDFIAGQFHANPWDRGTNEGEVEWPPAPWRLLRAVVSGWYRAGGTDRDALLRILDTLAEPPVFDLPLATSGHTRHYVPLGGLKGGRPERTLMLDSFIALDRNREHGTQAYVLWPNGELLEADAQKLQVWCGVIRYLGRAESWCEVSVMNDIPVGPGRYRVDLASRDEGRGPTVRRLAPSVSLRGNGLLRALSESTGEMRRSRRAMPQGTAWLEYRLPPDFGWVSSQALLRTQLPEFPPSIFRFALDVENGVLPAVTQTLTVSERMRHAAINRYSAMQGAPASKRIAGKTDDGSDRREGHDHPFFLPLDLRDRGVIDALDVWFPQGCTHDEFRAVTAIDAIWDRGILDARLAVTYLGRFEPVSGTCWTTVTPVVLDRFPKRRGAGGSVIIDSPEEQLLRALERRGYPAARVLVWDAGATIPHRRGGRIRLDAFRRARLGEKPNRPVIGATIVFERPVEGPLVLGRLAHFGLGRFDVCEQPSDTHAEAQ